MTATSLRYRSYRWRGQPEWLLEAGDGPSVLLIPPLFEELNRCRAFLVAIVRGLAEAGFHAVLPDLPGTGESERDLVEIGWQDWTEAVGLLSLDLKARGQAPVIASFRGGALLEEATVCACLWRFSPVPGKALTRDLVRAKQASAPAKLRADAVEAEARRGGAEFAGYHLSGPLFTALADAEPPPGGDLRTLRLVSDAGTADEKVEGRPLWRQAEPGTDPALSARLSSDIVSWARACAA